MDGAESNGPCEGIHLSDGTSAPQGQSSTQSRLIAATIGKIKHILKVLH